MFNVVKYSDSYEGQYCDLYINTWKIEPYGELFTVKEVTTHLVKNKDYLYLLIDESKGLVIGFVGGRPILKDCPFFINETNIDLNKTFYVDEVGIDEKHKHLGWGETLMHYIMSCAGEDGLTLFVLRTHSDKSNPAIRLYEKLGFTTRQDKNGKIHGVDTKQTRIDNRPETDHRMYFYKEYTQKNGNK